MSAATPAVPQRLSADVVRPARRVRQPRQPRRIPCLPFVLWLGIMAGLFVWKGANYAEARVLLDFLGWSAATSTAVWWSWAALFGLLAVAGLGCMLYRRFIRR